MRVLATILFALMACGPALSGDDAPAPPAPDFWVLSLSWNPEYCVDHAREPECTRAYTFVVHGLWPEKEDEEMENCARVSRLDGALTERMLPLMPSVGLIQHEWYKHGSCSGMDAEQYFLGIERLHRALVMPGAYSDLPRPLSTTLRELKAEFALSNPEITAEKMTAVCSGRYLKEVRLCYDRDFRPRECGERVHDRCGEKVTLRATR